MAAPPKPRVEESATVPEEVQLSTQLVEVSTSAGLTEGCPDLWLLVCRTQSDDNVEKTEVLNLAQGCVLRCTTQRGGIVFQAMTYLPSTAWDSSAMRFT